MQIGALSFKPYIYNANYVSGSSLGKVSAIPDDLLTAQTDYSDLLTDDLNENPLQRGETANFADVLQMQFQMSRLNASRLIKPIEETDELLQNQVTENRFADTMSLANAQEGAQFDIPEMPEEILLQDAGAQASAIQMERNLYMMQKASEAYRVNMLAW